MDAIDIMRMAFAACTGARAIPALMKIARMVRTSLMGAASAIAGTAVDNTDSHCHGA